MTDLPRPQLSFEQRAAPVERAVATGDFDPKGGNYTPYAKTAVRKKPVRSTTRLGSVEP